MHQVSSRLSIIMSFKNVTVKLRCQPLFFVLCKVYNNILVYLYSYKTKWAVDITWTVIPFSNHKLFRPYFKLNKIALNSFFEHIENLGQVMS